MMRVVLSLVIVLAVSLLPTFVVAQEGKTNALRADLRSDSKKSLAIDTLYVPQDYATIQSAINTAVDHTVILVAPGVYNGSLLVDKPVEIKSLEGPLVTTITDVPTNDLVVFLGAPASQASLEGFTLIGGRIGVWCQNAGPLIKSNIFAGQTIQDWGTISLGGEFFGTTGISPARIINNTIVNSPNGGVSSYSTEAPTIKNNIMNFSGHYAVHIHGDLPADISYNCVFGQAVTYYFHGELGPGALHLDPLLSSQFMLTQNSPCRDAGDPAPQFNDPNGSRNDIGAVPYETEIPEPVGDTLYVPTDFATIQSAINAVADGGVVFVLPGSYAGGILIDGKSVQLQSIEGPLGTRISAGNDVVLLTVNGAGASNSVIEGFTLDGGLLGIWCKNSGPMIKRNLFVHQYATNWAAIALSGSSWGSIGASPAQIINNTIVQSTGGGISIYSNVAPVIQNNIIAFNAKYGIHLDGMGPAAHPEIGYNDIFGNPVPFYNIDPGSGALAVDPLVNPNFTLRPLSPCIDAGNPNEAFNDPDGSRSDIGALPVDSTLPSNDLLNLTQWSDAEGGNNHWYAVIPQLLYWDEADSVARSLEHDGIQGHLATITTPEENQFIMDHILAGTHQPYSLDEFWLYARYVSGGWQWLTGEPFLYTNWAPNEPNRLEEETALEIFGPNNVHPGRIFGTWNNAMPRDEFGTQHKTWSVVEFGETSTGPGPFPTNEWIVVTCAQPKLNGQALAPGTVVRAVDPSNVTCGLTVVRQDGSLGYLLVYGDDAYTDFDEGAVPGDLITFKIGLQTVQTAPAVQWTQHGDEFNVCNFTTGSCQQIQLSAGWNLISWNLKYSGPVAELIDPVKNHVELVMGFNNGGLVYDPQLPQLATLTQVDYYHGYWIKMNAPASLSICGEPITLPAFMELDQGWNLISYWPATPLAPQEAFTTINENLQVAVGFENGIKIYIPSNPNFNTLDQLKPGLGYWVRLAADDGLDYGFLPTPGADRPSHGESRGSMPNNSREWMSIYGENLTLNGAPVAENSHIEAFTAEGILIGSGMYADGRLKFMPIYGDDGADNASAKFAREGDVITLRVNDTPVEPTVTWSGHGTLARIGDLISNGLPSSYLLYQNYPNPFNPDTRISFELPHASKVKLVIYDLLGRQVRTLADAAFEAGAHEVLWDGRDDTGDHVSSGIYFYRLESAGFAATRKMMLIK